MISQIVQTLVALIDISIIFFLIFSQIDKHFSDMPSVLKLMVSGPVWLFAISALYFFELILKVDFCWFVSILLPVLFVCGYFIFRGSKTVFPRLRFTHTINSSILWLSVLLSCLIFFFHAGKYGDYDAWALWNSHARFLFDIQHWKALFADNYDPFHADYPLFLPALIAFFWHVAGSNTFIVPLLFSLVWIIQIQLLMFSAINSTAAGKSAVLGFIGLFILVFDVKFQGDDGAQCADMIMSLWILLTIVLSEYAKIKQKDWSNLIGFFAASAMWVKNEGILFFIIFSVIYLFVDRRPRSAVLKYFAGALLPVLIVVCFKVSYAPANDLVSAEKGHFSQILHDLFDINRYLTIGKAFYKELLSNCWPMMIMVIFAIFFLKKGHARSSFLTLVLLVLGYIFVYLITPYDLSWHLATSLTRLLYHVYPSVIFLILISVKQQGLILME